MCDILWLLACVCVCLTGVSLWPVGWWIDQGYIVLLAYCCACYWCATTILWYDYNCKCVFISLWHTHTHTHASVIGWEAAVRHWHKEWYIHISFSTSDVCVCVCVCVLYMFTMRYYSNNWLELSGWFGCCCCCWAVSNSRLARGAGQSDLTAYRLTHLSLQHSGSVWTSN